MNAQSKILIGLGIVCFVAGILALFVTRTAVRYVVADDMYVLTRYDPNSEYYRTAKFGYDDLYHLTNRIARQRNHCAFVFFYTLTTALFVAGTLLTVWAIDRHRLKRVTLDLTRSEDDGRK